MDTKIQRIHLACTLTPGIGPQRFLRLKNSVSTLTELYNFTTQELAAQVGIEAAQTLYQYLQKEGALEKRIQDLHLKHIGYIAQSDTCFPTLLSSIVDPPIGLFVANCDEPLSPPNLNTIHGERLKIAIVGSRKHTSYGKVATEQIVHALGLHSCTIVSGMALGIDTIAHKMALTVGTPTIAVLGSGLNYIYPSENKRLFEDLCASGNYVISEFAPDVAPSRGSFIARNRIVSGMCRATIIIEGDEKSGSLTTAGFAAEQNREVFALPGPITSPLSQAPLRLLREGALLLTRGEDVLEYYNVSIAHSDGILPDVSNLSTEEKNIVELISKEPLHPDDIARTLNKNMTELMCALTELELKNLLSKDQLGRYYFYSTKS